MAEKVTHTVLAKFFTGNCSHEEQLLVENWRNASDANQAEFDQYRAIWENAASDAKSFKPDVSMAMDKVNSILNKEASVGMSRTARIPAYLWRVAAAILLGVGIWTGYYLVFQNRANNLIVAESGNVPTQITLIDGTLVWLNSNSKLSYSEKFSGNTRTVSLEGEAYFEVAKNAKKPFIIESNLVRVKVLGTKFNLRARNMEQVATVSVTEGKVAFSEKNASTENSLLLIAGDKGIYNHKVHELRTQKIQSENVLSWKTGKLMFKNVPLGTVAEDLSTYYNRSILVDSDKLSIPFTGSFERQQIQEVLQVLEMSLGIKADTSKQEIWLK